MAPQWLCPQMMIWVIFRAWMAYSMAAPSPPLAAPKGGIMFPALRMTNRSPGSALTMMLGTMRESEQVMKRTAGV